MTDTAAATAQTVPVRDSDGEIRPYLQKDVKQAIEAGGEVATPQEVRHAELQEKFGGLGGQAAAFAGGAASGLTFGGSDAAIAAMGGREALKNYYDANPDARTAGEVGGIGASLLIPGLGEAKAASLAGKGARLATAAPRIVSGAGHLAEAGVAKLLTREGAGLAERAAVKGLSGAAAGGLEGAAYGMAHEVSDAAVEDHDLAAEKLLAGAKHGALWGAGVGGGLGIAGELVSSGARKIADAVTEKVGSSSLADVLDTKSGEIAFRSAGGGKAVSKAANKFGEGYAEVGKIWRDDAPGLVGKDSFAGMTREDLRVASGKGMAREGEKLGNDLATMTKKAEAAGTLPNAMTVVSDIEDVARKVGQRAGAEPAVAKLEAFAESVKRIAGLVDETGALLPDAGMKQMTYEQLRNFRTDADNMWKGASRDPNLTGSAKYFGDVRDAMEQRVLDGAKEAGVLDSYAAAKNKYQAFKLLERATEGGVAAQGSNRFFSLTDNLATHAGSVVGATIAGPVGAAIGAGIGGMASRAVRTRGDFLAADLLKRVTQMGNMESMAASVDKRIERGVTEFLLGAKDTAKAEAARARPTHAESLAQAQQITAAISNPAIVQERLNRFAGNAGDVAPNITASMATKVANAYSYLGDKMPTLRGDPASLTPQFVKWRASEAEVAKAARFIEGAQDPLSILDDMRHGALSREKIQSVRANYPKLFEQIQMTIAEQAPKLEHELTYRQKLQLEILLGVPTDPSLQPEFVAMMQATKQANPDQPKGGAPAPQGGSSRPLKLDTSIYKTDSQALSSK